MPLMSIGLENIVYGLFGMIFGCILVFLNKPLALFALEYQNTLWGFRFDVSKIKSTRIIFIITGTGFIIVGLLSLLHIIQFR
jgi:hypothetical protein